MLRVTTIWSGFSGAPGYTNMYFGGGLDGVVETAAEATGCATKVREFFNSLSLFFPTGVTLTVQPTVAKLDEGTGELEDEFQVTPAPANVVGSGPGAYAAPAGACVNWRTATIVSGRRLRGKTFLVPLGGNAMQTDGTLAPAAVTAINGAGATLATGPLGAAEPLVVWARPREGTGGSVGRVISGSTADKAAVLRSRRD